MPPSHLRPRAASGTSRSAVAASTTSWPISGITLPKPGITLPTLGGVDLPISDLDMPEVFRILDLIGIVLNGVLGGMVAREHRLDIIGFMTLAIAAALGGGMMRDVLLQVGPPLALEDPWYIPTAVIAAYVAWLINFEGRVWRISAGVLDGIVIGVWAATGTVKALSHGFAWPPALLLGVMTAVGGGMLRDVFVGRMPAIFGGSHLYATSALIGSLVALGFFHLGLPGIGLIASAIIASGFFLLSRWNRWMLPQGGEDIAKILTEAERKLRRIRNSDDENGFEDQPTT